MIAQTIYAFFILIGILIIILIALKIVYQGLIDFFKLIGEDEDDMS